MFITTDLSKSLSRLDGEYEKNWYEWLPETLRTVITNRWGGIRSIGLDRILAARNLIKSGWFWHDVDVFEATTHSFNWQSIDYREDIHPSPGQIVNAINIALKLIDEKDHQIDEDVAQYIASVFLERNYIYVPDEFHLGASQAYMDIFNKKPELRDAIKDKWKSMMSGEEYELQETQVDVQLARLLAIKKFVEVGGTGVPMEKEKALAKMILN